MKIENIKFEKNSWGGWLVLGDTERFGEQEILFESHSFAACLEYLKETGNEYTLMQAIAKVKDVQLSINMYHRVHINEAGKVEGYNNKRGWLILDLEGFELVEPLIAKRDRKVNNHTFHETLKLGFACSW